MRPVKYQQRPNYWRRYRLQLQPPALPGTAVGRGQSAPVSPYIPAPSPKEQTSLLPGLHGEPSREDPFQWLQAGQRDARVLQYLRQENEYAKLQLHHLAPLRKQLEQEIAEEVWRQAVMMAAQQPHADARTAEDAYGPFMYRREPAPGAPGRFRHLRVPSAPPTHITHGHSNNQSASSLSHATPRAEPPPGQEQHAAAPQHASGYLAAATVVDEELRAVAAPVPAAYTLHSFAPSPAFDLAAFTEATEQVPAGARRPDRFALHVVDAATGGQMLPPLPDVSGDVRWVTAAGCDAGAGGVRGCGARLYFTRAAQRELWCVDVAQPQAPASLSDNNGGETGPAPPPPRLVFRDPDGQPIQLACHGDYLCAESLGNSWVPLEVRLLGPARADPPPGPAGAAAAGEGAGAGRSVAPVPQGAGLPAEGRDGGVPLLPRAPGRQYSVHPIQLALPGLGIGRQPDGSGNVSCTAPEATVVWLRDPDHSNGCLLLAPLSRLALPGEASASAAAPGSASPSSGAARGGGLKVPVQPPPPALLELLAHDPSLRILHLEVAPPGPPGPPGRLLLVRVCVEAGTGDTTDRLLLQELHVHWRAAQRAALAEADGGSRDAAGCGGVEPSGVGALYLRLPAAGLATVVRGRWVAVPDGRHAALRVVSWDAEGGEVTLSYNTMASPPVTCTVKLLPPRTWEAQQKQPQQQQEGAAAHDNQGVASAEDAEVVQLRRRVADPRFELERLWASSHDGAQVPITLCRLRADADAAGADGGPRSPPGPAPLLLRVYGAYGSDPPLDYQPALLPLLRRGVAVAVAHVRGGGRLGPGWYEGGRGGGRKANSALDLLAAAGQLVRSGVTAPELMCLEAESAGGWAAGPALNSVEGSALFRAALLTVPTLDVMTSLLEDPSYGPYELGDPRTDADVYRDIMAWCPYQGLARNGALPALMLLRIGLYDTNVPYWDPAKYMARLRSLAAKDSRSALRVMQVRPAGHDAYDGVSDDALRCAFVLWALGSWHGRAYGRAAGQSGQA